jgi:hypothetical protein
MFFVSYEVPAIDICCWFIVWKEEQIQRRDAMPDVAVINIV